MVRPADPESDDGLALGRAPAEVAFVVQWTSGPDPSSDAPLRLLALRGCAGNWSWFEAWIAPERPGPLPGRVHAALGVTARDLENGDPATQAWRGLLEFLGAAPVVTAEGRSFRAWRRHWVERLHAPDLMRASLGLDELATLALPGRLEPGEGGLVRTLLGDNGRAPAALEPTEIAAALDALARPLLSGDPRLLDLVVTGLARARQAFLASDPDAAAQVELVLALLDRPDLWAGASGELFGAGGTLPHGRLRLAAESAGSPDLALEGLDPAVAERYEDWRARPDMPPDSGAPSPFHPADTELLDQLLDEHLPSVLAAQRGGDPRDYQRESQAQVARQVARTLGADELLLVHAPTGTGKTLGYLLPAILWARRNGVRIGIATYTRALQEQAMEREVPTALAALARAGVPPGTLVSVLKGRENYLCWRALRAATPEADDDGEAWLAWTVVVLFALRDAEGDLDRISAQPPIAVASSATYRRAFAGLLRTVRSATSCCTAGSDRRTCAAELARARAERSHVVITNHAFALARKDFFRHLVFDECEHLHDQAANAWSHRTTFRSAREVLLRLHRPRSIRGRAPLDRLARQLLEGTPSGEALGRAMGRWQAAAEGLSELESEAGSFDAWRQEAGRGRGEREVHGLFREYLGSDHAPTLLMARVRAAASLAQLESALDMVGEVTEKLPLRGAKRIRRGLEVARGELVVLAETIEAWLPIDDGQPRLPREAFHDVESLPDGDLALVARVLLPHEVLGRFYHPSLGSAVLLSATTWLRGGFDASKKYLGLARAEQPGDREERPGRTVRTFRAPEAFDYSRVLVGVPRDVPPPAHKQRHLEYITSFVSWLSLRTRGRMLVLFTNREDVRMVGEALSATMAERHLPLYWQGMPEASKEELSALFRSQTNSILLGVDTFWYGADFPGDTLQYLIIARLPYGVPDRYHHAQCAAIGEGPQRASIYQPRALAKFRQGFGRLMRRTSDRGCIFVMDPRILDPRHRIFLRELPLGLASDFGKDPQVARLVRGDSRHVLREAFAHMELLSELQRRELTLDFEPPGRAGAPPPLAARDEHQRPERTTRPGPISIDHGELPF